MCNNGRGEAKAEYAAAAEEEVEPDVQDNAMVMHHDNVLLSNDGMHGGISNRDTAKSK